MDKISPLRPQVFILCALYSNLLNDATAFDPTRDKLLYAVGYGHLDDQWNWTVREKINNFIPDSLHQNFAFFTNAYFRMLNAFSRIAAGGLKCERHLADEAVRKVILQKQTHRAKKGISRKAQKQMESSLNLL